MILWCQVHLVDKEKTKEAIHKVEMDEFLNKGFFTAEEEKEYKNKFKVIAFAIINSNSNYKEHNPEGNFKPFKEEFS